MATSTQLSQKLHNALCENRELLKCIREANRACYEAKKERDQLRDEVRVCVERLSSLLDGCES